MKSPWTQKLNSTCWFFLFKNNLIDLENLNKREVQFRHRKILSNLGVTEFVEFNNNKIIQSLNFFNKEQLNYDERICNISSQTLSKSQKSLLKEGLKFGIKSNKLDSYYILWTFEHAVESPEIAEIKLEKISKYHS